MKEKLTLSLEKQTKKRAKRYAKSTGQSVSEMVEGFLNTVADGNNIFQPEPGSVTESLMGSLELPKKFKNMDYKQIKEKILREKFKN